MSMIPPPDDTEMDEARASRAATLSAVNGHILRHVRDSPEAEQEWEFFCECGWDDCHEHVFLTLDAITALRVHGGVVLADGHELSQVARARRLRDNAEALRRQAAHQVKRAMKNLHDLSHR